MNKPRSCGCKGCRTCLICEKEYGLSNPVSVDKNKECYIYCPWCNKAWPGWDLDDYKTHPDHKGTAINYPGIYIELDFLSTDEEHRLASDLDSMPWELSQSGRRKQNFGPRCNFKKLKLRPGNFDGFPKCTKFVQDKFKEVPLLNDFLTIEQCSLEYDPDRGASIDPHIDDCWIWGERIVTVNLLADSVLTMTAYNGELKRYNLDCVERYPAVLNANGTFNKTEKSFRLKQGVDENLSIVRIPMPRRSLLIMYGQARYDWLHQVLREDITSRRVCLAYREFTPPYLPGGSKYATSYDIFWGVGKFW